MATPKKSASAKLFAVLIAVILVFGSLVAVFFAYTWYVFRTPYANITPSPYVTPPTPPTVTPSPGTSPPTISQSPSPTPSSPPTDTPAPTPTVVTLSNAISQGLVQASFSGKGSCAGDCIKLTIKSLVAYPLEITPPPSGTVLTASTASSAQNMVLQQLQGIDYGTTYKPATTILLSDQNSVTYIFKAYCLEFHKDNPTSSDQFTIAGTADSDVVKVLNAAATQPASVANIAAVQTAIWVVTDNISLQDLNKSFPSGVSEVNNAKTILQAAGIDITGKALFAAPTAT